MHFTFKLFSRKINLCPICGNTDRPYLPLPDMYAENSKKHGYEFFGTGEMTALDTYTCPKCGASDRERLYAHWLKEKLSNVSNKLKMIHFAPEPSLSVWLKENYDLEYSTADLSMSGVDHQLDMMSMSFGDCEFDCFICSHVLEHVEDDGVALDELYRILKVGGWGILMVPISTAISNTLEDKSHTSDADRWKHYGQNDHVRLYAHNDYVDKVRKHKFVLHEFGLKYFSKRVFAELGLKETSILYVVEKPI